MHQIRRRVLVQVTLNIADDKVVDDSASSFTSIEGLALSRCASSEPPDGKVGQSSSLDISSAVPVPLSTRRQAEILLVEDNDYNVDVGKQMLEFLGHSVTVAFNGKEAVDAIVQRDRDGQWTASSQPFDIGDPGHGILRLVVRLSC